jgi:secreted PhoX family phosphatase
LTVAALATPGRAAAPGGSTLDFAELPRVYDERHHVAPGHTAQVLLRWGDPLFADAPAFDPQRQSAAAQRRQFGYDCDFIAFMPLAPGSSTAGLLCVNNEFVQSELMLPGIARKFDAARPKELAEIEMAAHGHSIVEVALTGGSWAVKRDSRYNRRLTALDTLMAISGPAAGHRRLRTRDDPTGRAVIGTLANCAGGETPWGTLLIAEENIHHYFGGDPRGTAEERNHLDMGMTTEVYFNWFVHHPRFDLAREPHEPNRFGWMVEIDPYDPAATPVKRTALGRFKHEGAGLALAPDGRVVIYSGDDEVFQFVYRFVSRRAYRPDDTAANRDLLDDGELSVARFGEDRTVTWLPLVWGTGPLTPENGFADQGDVLIECRRAARLLGATPMDRPEEVVPNPVTGTVFVALTKNAKRAAADAANPRRGNRHGHLLELLPPGHERREADHAAPVFRWRPFLLAGDPRAPDSGAQYHADVSRHGWFSNPDNLAFDRLGRIWITTDGGNDFGRADGLWAADVEGPGRALTRHFFACPRGAELTGPCFTPDNTTLFCSVQHPGEEADSTFARPATRWPDFAKGIPPRPSVVAIRRSDGRPLG